MPSPDSRPPQAPLLATSYRRRYVASSDHESAYVASRSAHLARAAIAIPATTQATLLSPNPLPSSPSSDSTLECTSDAACDDVSAPFAPGHSSSSLQYPTVPAAVLARTRTAPQPQGYPAWLPPIQSSQSKPPGALTLRSGLPTPPDSISDGEQPLEESRSRKRRKVGEGRQIDTAKAPPVSYDTSIASAQTAKARQEQWLSNGAVAALPPTREGDSYRYRSAVPRQRRPPLSTVPLREPPDASRASRGTSSNVQDLASSIDQHSAIGDSATSAQRRPLRKGQRIEASDSVCRGNTATSSRGLKSAADKNILPRTSGYTDLPFIDYGPPPPEDMYERIRLEVRPGELSLCENA